MNIFEADFEELISFAKEDIINLGFDMPVADTQFPAIRYRSDEIQSDEISNEYNITFQLFLPFPEGCLTFENALQLSKKEVVKYFKFIEELVIGGFCFHKNYERIGKLLKRTFYGKGITEHNLIVVQLSARLNTAGDFKCCLDGTFFNFDAMVIGEGTWRK